jgi:uncharacterized protein YndB with AHSA1/START domain
MASFRFERVVTAPPEIVFDVITDHRRYAEMTPLRRSELEREGKPPPNGVGAVRVLTAVGPPLREEVLVYERPTRFSYKVISGLPVRNHVGTVELSPEGEGTKLAYAVRMTPTVPLAGAAVVAGTKVAIKQLIRGVAAESERRAAAG